MEALGYVSAHVCRQIQSDNLRQIWDPRTKEAVGYIPTEFPITAMALSEAGNELFTGGIDNDIKVWDLRKQAVTYTLMGHTDTVTSLQLSPDNVSLLSNSHDSTVRTWDIRPFAPADRRIRTYDGAPAGTERNLLKASWDSKGERIAAGGGDQNVTIWDVRTGKITNKLPGHRGAVNDVRFSPGDQPLCKSKPQPLSLSAPGARKELQCRI
jgi:Prp8 binding protein